MPRKRIDVSHKMRRLVERAIKLHVEKATAVFQPASATGISLADSNAARDNLHRRARIAKENLLEQIGKTERYLEENKKERRRLLGNLHAFDSVQP
jgi:hypothetical protein